MKQYILSLALIASQTSLNASADEIREFRRGFLAEFEPLVELVSVAAKNQIAYALTENEEKFLEESIEYSIANFAVHSSCQSINKACLKVYGPGDICEHRKSRCEKAVHILTLTHEQQIATIDFAAVRNEVKQATKDLDALLTNGLLKSTLQTLSDKFIDEETEERKHDREKALSFLPKNSIFY